MLFAIVYCYVSFIIIILQIDYTEQNDTYIIQKQYKKKITLTLYMFINEQIIVTTQSTN